MSRTPLLSRAFMRRNSFAFACAIGLGATIAWHQAPQTAPSETNSASETKSASMVRDFSDYAPEELFSLAPAPLGPITTVKTAELVVGKGDTLIDMLLKHDIDNQQAHLAVDALRKEYDPRKLKVGQRLALTVEKIDADAYAALKSLIVELPLATVTLEQNSDGFGVAREDIKLSNRPFYGDGEVSTSLYQAAYDAGIPEGAMAEIVSAFSFDVDFQRDIHPGNRIEVMVDERVAEDGRVLSYDNARYAKLQLKGRTLEIFKFKDARGIEGWFDAKGNSVKKSLLRTPVNAARLSSGFGMRKHPILGYRKMHRGVDFAAPTGTPIYAAGDGVIAFKGRKGGYGNYIKIRHNGTYDTAYAHMHKFARGMRNGKVVKQGQVIGYVGTTGRSTGPHLHYEVLQNGKQVNPRSAKFNVADPLAGKQLAAFKEQMRSVKTELAEYRDSNDAPQQVAQLEATAENNR